MDQSFQKSLRLTHKGEIESLFSSGRRVKSHPFIIIYNTLPKKKNTPFKLLISVPKRNFKKAVDRNFLKRRIREVVRKNKELLSGKVDCMFHIAILYSFNTRLEYEEIETNLLAALKKIQ